MKTRRLALWTALSVLFAALPALAQDQDEENDEEQERPVVVDTIVVTAQKRAEDLQDVPVAVSAIGEEELEAISAGGPDVRMLSARSPSVVAESSFGRAFPRFYVRGLGNTDFDLNASQPVSFLYDDIVLENAVLKGKPLFDLERVEILRGPQGTLFGRNTPAGVVRFQSRRPTRESEAFVRGSLGTYQTSDVQAAFSGPLSQSVSARLSLLYQGRSDWVDNTFTGENDALGGHDLGALRLQFLFEPSDSFTGLLRLHGWDHDGTARLFRANVFDRGTTDLRADFDPEEIAIDGVNEQTIEGQGASLELEWDFGGAVLTSITGYETLEMFSRGDVDGGFGADFLPGGGGPGSIPFSSETADAVPDLEQLTQEFRLSNFDGATVGWVVGLYLFDEALEIETLSYDSLAGNALNGAAYQTQDAEAWALFGSVDYDLTDQWELRAGLRWSADEKDFQATRPNPIFQTPTAAPIERNTDADFLSWDASATYKASEDVSVYGRVATSFRAPSIQGRILFCPDFEGGTNPATNCVSVADEEEILSTEIGFKSELADNRVRLNAAVYRYEVDGQQIVAVGGEFNTATLLNADRSEGYGFELDLTVAPSPAWLVTVGLSHNDTEIQDADLAVAPCGGGCTVLDPIGPNGALVDGNSLPHAPEWIFNGIVDYRAPLGGGLLVGGLDWAYHDEKSFFLYESVEFNDDAFELGARLAYVFSDGRYELGIYGRNLTDEVTVRAGIDFNNITGMINDPRTFGLQFGVNF